VSSNNTSATVSDQGLQISAVRDRTTAVEAELNDVLGDGSDIDLNAFAANTQTLETQINDGTTGLAATNTLAQSTSGRLEDVGGDGSNVTIEALADTVSTTSTQVAANTSSTDANLTSIQNVESRIDDVDGAGTTVESLAAQQAAIETTANSANDTANTALTTSQNAESRINAVDGGSKTIEGLASDVAANATSASTASANANSALNTANGLLSRINDTAGDGSDVTIEALAAQTNGISTTASNAESAANAAVLTANSAASRLDSVDGGAQTVEALATQVVTVSANASSALNTANDADALATSLNSTVTTLSNTVSSIENGVSAQWQVQATAADITGVIGLFNDNGDVTALIEANRLVVRAPGGVVPLFEVDPDNPNKVRVDENTFGRVVSVSQTDSAIPVVSTSSSSPTQVFSGVAIPAGQHKVEIMFGMSAAALTNQIHVRLVGSNGLRWSTTYNASVTYSSAGTDPVHFSESLFGSTLSFTNWFTFSPAASPATLTVTYRGILVVDSGDDGDLSVEVYSDVAGRQVGGVRFIDVIRFN